MSQEVICLSDSDEPVEPARDDERNSRHGNEEMAFSFPPVEFTYYVQEFANVTDKKQNKSHALGKNKKNDTHESVEYVPRNGAVTRIREEDPEFTDRFRERLGSMGKGAIPKKVCVSRGISRTEGNNKDREAPELSRETRAKQAARVKFLKALDRKNLKKIQPGECLKCMKVCLDRGLEKFGLHLCIANALVYSDISWEMENLLVVNSIMWIRETEECYIDDSNEICTRPGTESENHLIIIWNCDEAVGKIKEGIFVCTLKNTLNLVPSAQATLIIYGTGEYFRYNKKGGKQNSSKVSKQDLEIHLAEIQITLNCSSQLIDTPEDLGSLVYRFTKSIAEIPYKLEKNQKLAQQLDWYATGDNRDTVRVDKNGNGLRRLWQQQLCQFNLASLETAEAISSVYQSPFQLMEAYRKCTRDEGEKLLKDIPIRRAAGPLSTVRKIGPELSKKVFIMFTSKDGETALSNGK